MKKNNLKYLPLVALLLIMSCAPKKRVYPGKKPCDCPEFKMKSGYMIDKPSLFCIQTPLFNG